MSHPSGASTLEPGHSAFDARVAGAILAIILAGLVFGCVALAYPFGRDQGNYAYPAWVWLDGGMPYRDVYVFKPPGTVWVHALAQGLFGTSMLGIRVLDIGWTIATAATLATLARRWFPAPWVAPLAGVFYIFLYANFDFWNTCQTDGWLNLPALGAVLLALRAAEQRTRAASAGLVGAGALLGLAMCLKYTAVVFAAPLVIGLVAAGTADRRGPKALAARIGLVGAGLAVPLVATALWLGCGGALPGFLDSQLGLVPSYVAKTGRADGAVARLSLFATRLVDLPALRYVLLGVAAGLFPLACGLGRTEGRAPSLAALALLAAGAVSCFVQNKFFRYHYLPLLPGAALLGALGAATALARLRGGRVAAVVGGFAVLVATSEYPGRWAVLGRLATGGLALEAHWDTAPYRVNKMSVADNLAAAEWIARETAATDRVFVWGFDPMVNFVARRKTVSRFLYNYPFAVSWGDPRYEAELLDALAADPPALFVVGSKDATPHVTGTDADSKALFERFAALRAFVSDRYGPATRVARFDIYRIRPDPTGATR